MKLRFEMRGLDGIAGEFARLSKKAGKVADDMVKAGCAEGVNAYKSAIEAHGHVDTGAMRDSVKMGPIHHANGAVYALVYPSGKDGKGVDNYLKAMKLNWGTSRISASHFVEEARDNASEPAGVVMRNIFESMKEG